MTETKSAEMQRLIVAARGDEEIARIANIAKIDGWSQAASTLPIVNPAILAILAILPAQTLPRILRLRRRVFAPRFGKRETKR